MNDASTPYRSKEKIFFADTSKKNIIRKSSYKNISAERSTACNASVMINNPSTFKEKNKDLLTTLLILIAG